jgi:type I restriction enzyme S subunit
VKLKPYPAYKDSGVPWLGKMPAQWKMESAKWLFRKMDRPVQESDEVVTCFRDGVVTLRKNRRVRGFTESLKEIGYQGIRRGDLVIHAMDAFAGAIGVSDSDGKGTPVYSVCEPVLGVDAHYYAYTIREMARSQWIQALARGIRERSTDFRFDDFGSQLVPLPPLPEQAAIVRFLDYMDRRVRRYIRAKQKLVKLLEEQKQVIIHQAVTRGLDPNVRLKPSGVEWLGDVPEHWKLVQLRRLISLVTSGSRGWANFYSETGDIFLQSGNLGRSMSLNLSFLQHVQPPPGSEGERTKVQRDDVLVCITGALTGNVAHVDIDLPATAFVNQHVALVRPNQAIIYPRYLSFALHSEIGRIQFKAGEYGGTKQGLSLDDVKSALVLLPPRSEQIAISFELDTKIAGLVMAVGRIEHEISLLREYRTRLIADVVTGKLDVRGVELPEVEEMVEQEDWEEDTDVDAEEITDVEEATDADK